MCWAMTTGCLPWHWQVPRKRWKYNQTLNLRIVVCHQLRRHDMLINKYGWTYHVSDIQGDTYLLVCAWIAQLIFTPAVSLVKESILVFYLRLSSNRPFRQAVYGGLVFIILWFIVFEALIAMVRVLRAPYRLIRLITSDLRHNFRSHRL